MLKLDQIGNKALIDMIEAGELDDPKHYVTRIFKHCYDGGQVDWGYIDQNGDYFTWFGGDFSEEKDVEDLDIVDEYPLDYVEGFEDWVFGA